MPNYLIRRLLILGGLAILGIFYIQSYWVIKTLDTKEKAFHQSVTIALRNVAQSLASFNNSSLPKTDLIKREASNYYAVNINDAIDANILEDYLIREFNAFNLDTDFEYAVYDCLSKDLAYGKYCRLSTDTKEYSRSDVFPKIEDEDLIYYFVVKFPEKQTFLLEGMRMSIVYSAIALFAVLFFIYSIWVILQQKRYGEMQKDFINNMTHEFKTPISSIKIASDVLLRDESLKSNSRLRQYTNIIKEQNQRLNNQVEKVLTMAKFEKQNFELKKERIPFVKILEDVVNNENMRLQESDKSGKINLNSQSLNGEMILADRVHFTNMIYNVIDNAVKYSGDAPNVDVSAIKDDTSILLSIQDKGIGIGKDEIKKIFKKFYRVPTGNVHNVKGFGLGLFYVKGICDSHKWKLDLQSKKGDGTTLKIRIPTTK